MHTIHARIVPSCVVSARTVHVVLEPTLPAFFSQQSELSETFPESDRFLFESTFFQSLTRFVLHDLQISMSRPCYVNVFQWNREGSSFGT